MIPGHRRDSPSHPTRNAGSSLRPHRPRASHPAPIAPAVQGLEGGVTANAAAAQLMAMEDQPFQFTFDFPMPPATGLEGWALPDPTGFHPIPMGDQPSPFTLEYPLPAVTELEGGAFANPAGFPTIPIGDQPYPFTFEYPLPAATEMEGGAFAIPAVSHPMPVVAQPTSMPPPTPLTLDQRQRQVAHEEAVRHDFTTELLTTMNSDLRMIEAFRLLRRNLRPNPPGMENQLPQYGSFISAGTERMFLTSVERVVRILSTSTAPRRIFTKAELLGYIDNGTMPT